MPAHARGTPPRTPPHADFAPPPLRHAARAAIRAALAPPSPTHFGDVPWVPAPQALGTNLGA
eukprot:203543-Chlamydomonas_euryale.AAC.1